MAKRLEALWASYERDVIPTKAGAIQRQESRRAFYAGAAALFGAVLRGLTEGEEPTEEDLRMLDELQEELVEHARDVAAGKA
jgi:biotin synthase-like enzyme